VTAKAMIEKLAKKVVTWQVQKNYLLIKDEKLYIYAYELLIGQAVNILIACFLAIVFHAYTTVLIFLVSYIPLRSYAGGHHAKSYNMCTIASTVMVCIICIAAKIIPYDSIIWVNLAGGIISGILIFMLAPVQDHNKPLEQVERECYRKRSREIWAAETALWAICYLLNARNISLAVTLGHLALSVMLCIGSVKNKKYAEIS